MQDLQLYTLVITSAGQGDLGGTQRQQLAEAGLLGEDASIVEQLSSNPAEQTIRGYYKGRYAEKMRTELEQLAQASGFSEIPVAGIDASTPVDGYYSVENATGGPPDAATENAQRFDLTLRHKGTQSDFFREIGVNPREEVDHEFGNDTDLLVAVPESATKVRWYDSTEGYERAENTETRETELGAVEIFDIADGESELNVDAPALIYAIGYTDEECCDVRVWDTRGESSKHDAEGDLQWRKVFSSGHETDADAQLVLDSGLLRVWLDEAAGTIEAEKWDSSSEEWTDVGLSNNSDWELYDVDVTDVAMVDVRAQLEFEHPDDGLFDLNVSLQRGRESLLVEIPEGETGPIPSGLEDWFEAIAAEWVVDPQPSKGLVARRKVRR